MKQFCCKVLVEDLGYFFLGMMENSLTLIFFGLYTLPETNSSPLQSYLLNRKVVFQPTFFRGYLSFREGIYRAEFEI